MPNPTVHVLRFSLVWTRPLIELPAMTVDQVPMPFLVDEAAYTAVFSQARTGARPHGVELPWPPGSRQLFWTYYLNFSPDDINGHQAWRHLVPFRARMPFAIATTVPGTRLFAEGFCFRHAVGFILNAVIEDKLDIAQAIDRLVKLRMDRVFELGTPTRRVRAAELAGEALSELCRRTTGTGLPAGTLAPPPFSIATPICVDGAPSDPLEQGDDVHRFVDALAYATPDWRTVGLPALAGSMLPIKQAPPCHLLYARDRARAVWYPSYATRPTDRPNRLSCYHRNLTFASMQTDALTAFTAAAAAAASRSGAALDASQEDCMRGSAGLLGRLYAGRQSYRTSSVRAQIDGDPRKAEVNTIRQLFNMQPL